MGFLMFFSCLGVGIFGFGQIEVCSDGFGPEMWRVSLNTPFVLLLFGCALVNPFADSFSLVFKSFFTMCVLCICCACHFV